MNKIEHLTLMASLLIGKAAVAQNPIVQTWFTSDPAPMVHNGTLYVYTGHDEDKADFFLDAGVACLFDTRHGQLDRLRLAVGS